MSLKVGIAELLWQLGGLEETYLDRRSRGSIFPTCIVAHHFIITKGGWLFLYKFLDQYKMVVSHAHFCDTKGFYDLVFRIRAKFGSINHEPYFPDDIIRNEFSLQEQETKKEKWRIFSRVFEFIHYFEKEYEPLGNVKIEIDKINKLILTFPEIMETMNKKHFFINAYPDKAKEVMRRLAFTPNVGIGPLIVHKRLGYEIIQNKRSFVDKGK